MSVPHRVPRSAQAFAPGFFRTRDESTRRRDILPPWEALDLVHVGAPAETEDCANARPGWSEVKGIGLVWRSRVDDQACEGASPLLIRGEQIEVDRKGLVDSRVGKPLGDAVTIGLIRDVLADCWPVILRMGMLDMCPELRALAPQVGAASQPITGRAPRGRIDRGLWKPAAAEQGGHLWRVDGVIVGLAAVNGFHSARVSQDTGHIFWSAAIGEPIPGEETFNGYDKAVAVGRHGLEKRFRSGLHLTVYEHLALVTHETDVQASGMYIDTTVTLMWVGGEAPEVSSCLGHLNFPLPADHCGMLRGEASIIIKALQPTAYSVRSYLAPAFGSG